MSFSGDIKRELQYASVNARHCQIAELAGFLTFLGRIRLVAEETEQAEHDRLELIFTTENRAVAARVQMLVQRLLYRSEKNEKSKRLQPKVSVSRGKHLPENKSFCVCIQEYSAITEILAACKQSEWIEIAEDAFAANAPLAADARVCQKDCCKRALIRSCFMAAGSMSNPELSYHFEIACRTTGQAEQLRELINSYQLEAKVIQRKKYEVVYVKESEQIADLLNLMGAHGKLLEFEELRVVKDVRNSINRKVNCEVANQNKTVQAAQSQVTDIEYIQRTKGLSSLPDNLLETAELRLEYPDLPLQELCTYFKKPIGKSGLNHRLRKLKEIAAQIREERNE